jgi:hypothetical protein
MKNLESSRQVSPVGFWLLNLRPSAGVPYLCDVVRAPCSCDDAVAEFRLDETRMHRCIEVDLLLAIPDGNVEWCMRFYAHGLN